MSAQALTVYESLLASGIPEEKARAAAEAIDRDCAEVDTQYARLRDEIKDLRDEIKEFRSEVCLRLDALYRVLIGMLVGVVGIFAAVASFAVKFIFFGL